MQDNLKLLSPKIDVVFHALFRKENNKLTEAMISDILGEKVKIKENLDRHMDIKNPEQKLGVMDLRVELEDKTKCNIEVQLKSHEYENERFIYYLCHAYSSQLNKGENYDQLHKTISIVILDHELDELNGIEELDVKWHIRDNKAYNKLLTDKLEIVIIEIPKAKRIYIKNHDDKISQWMLFLDNPNSQEVSNIMDNNKDIKEAAEELKEVSGDYEIRRIAELKEKYIRDEHAAMQYAIKNEHKKGLEQGMEKGIEKVAKNLLKLNIEMDKIVEATGLTKEQILKLK